MGLMNKDAYSVQPDRLIYEGRQPVDAKNMVVAITAETDGVIRRGQVIDEAAGVYSVHAEAGTPSCIAAEDVEYAADDTDVIVPCYITGTYHADAVIASPELTEANVETLREKGIILK